MFVWSFILVHSLRPDEVMISEWNGYVREGLAEAAKWLIEVNLRKGKWQRNASTIYSFNNRSPRYLNKKRFAKFVRDPSTGLYVVPRKPTQDLVYIGYLMDFIKQKPPEQYNIEARSTQNRIRVRVPIPVPHQMQGPQYDELSEWTLKEYVGMRRILVAKVAELAGIGGTVANLERRAKYRNVA
jgi:hypothetical protein